MKHFGMEFFDVEKLVIDSFINNNESIAIILFALRPSGPCWEAYLELYALKDKIKNLELRRLEIQDPHIERSVIMERYKIFACPTIYIYHGNTLIAEEMGDNSVQEKVLKHIPAEYLVNPEPPKKQGFFASLFS